MLSKLNLKKLSAVFALPLLVASYSVTVGNINVAKAATITVNTTADEYGTGADCSLREAVEAANTDAAFGGCTTPGSGTDTIVVPSGTYTLTLTGAGENLNATGDLDILESVIIQGAGSGNTIIDGNNSDRILDIPSSVTGVDLEISGMTIQDGSPSESGGAVSIAVNNSLTSVDDVSFENNIGIAGGAILTSQNAPLTVSNSRFLGNSSSNRGGAINLESVADLTVNSSLFNENDASEGGSSITMQLDANLSINSSIFTNNDVSGNSGITTDNGGVILIKRLAGIQSSSITIANSYFGDNTYSSRPLNSSNKTIFLFDGETATTFPVSVNVSNSTFYNNDGALNFFKSTNPINSVQINSSTLSSTATTSLVHAYQTTIELQNTILSGATIQNCLENLGGEIVSGGYNISSDDTCTDMLNQSTDLNSTDPMIATSPVLINGTYVLPPTGLTSPAVDSGNTSLTTDQTGGTRPIDADGNGTATVDRGAYELPDTFPPVLTEVVSEPITTTSTSFSYTFNSTEAGTINMTGGCTPSTTSAVIGDNTITVTVNNTGAFNCTLTVTDGAGNVSNALSLDFTVTAATPTPTITPTTEPTVTPTTEPTITPSPTDTVTPLTLDELPALTIVCEEAGVNSTTTCTFELPTNRTLPSGFMLSIGNGLAGGDCTVEGTTVTCTNVPTGSLVGTMNIYAGIDGNMVLSGETVVITLPETGKAANTVILFGLTLLTLTLGALNLDKLNLKR